MRPRKNANYQEGFEGMRADYAAAKTGRFRRRRTGISTSGSGADYHYRSESDFLRIMEYARDMDRNDAVVGQMVDRAVQNIVQNGLAPDPKTGDPELDLRIKDAWWEWASDARRCSVDGEMVYRDLEKLALRHMFVDGDDLTLLTDEAQLQLVEAHRCRTPSSTRRNVVHGVLLDENRRRLEYWLTKDDIDPMRAVQKVSEIVAREAFDEEGNPVVLHLRNPKRVTQTRGVSAFAPVFDLLGMHEDLHFAKLVQQQVASCIAIIRERGAEFNMGTSVDAYGAQTQVGTEPFKRLVEELAPGMEIRGLPGEKILGFSPNVPNAEFFQQMRTVLQLIGVNLGMPLVMLLMDAADTNFSGWRGAMDQARMGFKDVQQHLIDHWETPIYRWRLRHLLREDRAIAALAAKAGPKYFAHEWQAPRWPYIQPLQDAQADQLRQRALQASPRRIHGDRAQDWNDTIVETVEDNSFAIEQAAQKAKELSARIGERVTWRELLFMTDPDMLKAVTTSTATGPTGGPVQQAAGLNGAQITAAVDVMGKLRSGTIAAAAAVELLAGMGIDRARAQAMVDATPAGAGGAESDRDFLRTVLTNLLGSPTLTGVIANSTDLGQLVEKTGLPRYAAYTEPFVPVVAPAGNLVSGNVVKDAAGDVVGGGILAAPENTGGSAPPDAPVGERGNDDVEDAAPQPEEPAAEAEEAGGAGGVVEHGPTVTPPAEDEKKTSEGDEDPDQEKGDEDENDEEPRDA